MKIQYCSDLHIEFEENKKFLQNHPLKICGDVLILAGDIIPLPEKNFSEDFFSFVSDNYKEVFWIPGNHEFYHTDLEEFRNSFHLKLKKNVSIVNNVEVVVDDVRFVFTTLWSKISKNNQKIIEQSVADFDFILKNDKKFKADDFNNLHEYCLTFLKNRLSVNFRKTVVVTHHLPSLLCNKKQHLNSPINEAFCADLTEYIQQCDAQFWIYGHSHFNQKPLYIGKTILLTNQLGYVHLNEHNDFMPDAYFSI